MNERDGSRHEDDAPRLALLVLGMHRSGTSALAGLLHLLGADLPAHLIPANPRNPKGYFESEPLYQLHDALFEEAASAWHDLSPFPAGFAGSPAGGRWRSRLSESVQAEFGDSHFFVVKDPRLCRLVPLWRDVLQDLDVEPRYLIPLRDPLEIARSLSASADLPEASGLLLWLEYFLAAERDTRGSPRTFVSYPALLADWRACVGRIESDLGLGFPRRSRTTDAEIDDFLSSEHRNQVRDPDEILQHEHVHPWVQTAVRHARELAAGGEVDEAALDALRAKLVEAESAFGPALAASEVSRRRQIDVATGHQEEIAALERERDELRDELRALRGKLDGGREQLRELSGSVRMLMRWVVDRARTPDDPVRQSLKATLDAIEKAEPAEISGIASTGLLLGEQQVRINELEGERAARARTVDEVATRLSRSEAQREQLADTLREREVSNDEALARIAQLRDALAEAQREARTQRAEAARLARDRERLVSECARLLREQDASA